MRGRIRTARGADLCVLPASVPPTPARERPPDVVLEQAVHPPDPTVTVNRRQETPASREQRVALLTTAALLGRVGHGYGGDQTAGVVVLRVATI